MKRNIVFILLSLAITYCLMFSLPACVSGCESDGDTNQPNGNNGQTEHHHSFEHVSAVDPTCTERGNVEYWFCSGCNTYSTDANGNNITTLAHVTLNALGHNYIYHDGKATTCTEDGWAAYQTCSRCDYTSYEEIIATGHTPSAAVRENENEATCTEDGSYDEVIYCSICEIELSREHRAIEATCHDWCEWEIFNEIQHSHTCDTCHYTEYENQQFDNNVCSVCGYEVVFTSGLTYMLTGNYYTVTGISSSSTEIDIVIPSVYDSVTVSAIAPNAFWGNTSITSVSIPASVTNVGNNAFQNCTMLNELIILGEDTVIGANAFLNCNNIATATVPAAVIPYLSGDNIISLTVTDGEIAETLLQNFTKLTTLTVPDISTLEYIFGNNKSILTSLTLTDCTVIAESAFEDFTALNEFNLPENITEIGKNAFTNTAYYNNGANWVFNVCYLDNYLIAADAQISGYYPITNGTTLIANCAFYECTNLTGIFIPESVTGIGSYAFYNCNGLTGNLEIPKSVTDISSYAFYNCSRLTGNLFIHAGVKSIGNYAFYNCSGFTGNLIIPKSVADIGSYAFYNCSGLTGDLNIPEGVTIISEHVFYGCNNLTSITIPDGVISICGAAFSSCSSLTNITISNSVINIDSSAFRNCYSLTSITIPESVATIGNHAFYGCTALAEINFNAVNCKNLGFGNNVFYNAGKNGDGIIVNIGANVIKIPSYLFYPYNSTYSPKIVSVNFAKNSVCEIIGTHSFSNCKNLTYITIPESVTKIGNFAFSGCTALQYNEYEDTFYLGNANNPYLVLIDVKDTSLTTYKISPNTKFIYDSAFNDCRNITNITIPKSVKSIGNYAFIGCSSLTSIVMPDRLTNIGEYVFYSCSNLTSIIIPDSVISIDDYAFGFCKNLESVFYKGTPENWNGIKISSYDNSCLTEATIYYYSEMEPVDEGNYWHYVDGVVTVW